MASNEKTGIIRTELGLKIAGTHITIYDVMDYVKGQYPANPSIGSKRATSKLAKKYPFFANLVKLFLDVFFLTSLQTRQPK